MHFRNSYYGKRFAQCWKIWLWSAVLALLCTMISYPGIWYSDSYVRVTTGEAVLNAMVKTLTGHRAPLNTDNAFTIVPSFFMAFSSGLTGHVALYTFGQAFAFFAAAFLLIRELNPRGRVPQYILLACCPLIYGMSVYYEAGIGCVTGIVGLILLFHRLGEEKSRRDRVIEFLLVVAGSFVTFGYRTNALTIVPVLAFYLLKLKTAGKVKYLTALALVLGLLGTKTLPWIFDIHSYSTGSVGIVWEMLTAIQRMPEEERENYLNYLDDLGGEGATREALEVNHEGTSAGFTTGSRLGVAALSAKGATMTALKKYVQLMVEKPGYWLGVKRDVILRSMGLDDMLDYSEYFYNRWDAMGEYGFNDSRQRKAFHQSFMTVCGGLSFLTLRPWVSFLCSAVLMILARLRKDDFLKRYRFVFWLAVFYYLAYLLDAPAYCFRYFYPSLFLMMILDAAILWRGGEALWKRTLRTERKEES